MIKKFRTLINDLIVAIISNLPGILGRKIRYFYWSRRFMSCGKNVIIDVGVIIQNPENIRVGNNVWIDKYVILIAGAPSTSSSKVFTIKENSQFKYERGDLVINDCVHIAPFCVVQAHGGVFIGENTGIASGSKVYSLSHHYRNPQDPNDVYQYKFTPMVSSQEQSLISSPVYIGNNCAIGLNSVILPGSIINDGTWVGALSFVMGELEGYSVYATTKTKLIRKLEENKK